MNFVKLYIGDYLRDTGDLSPGQHGIYLLMLMKFYATETPLPLGEQLYRLLSLQTESERADADLMAARFFESTERGLISHRAVLELGAAVRQAEINRQLGRRGGRPKAKGSKTESVTESVTESKPNREPNQEPNRNPNHSHSQKKQDQDHKLSSFAETDSVFTLHPEAAKDDCPHKEIIALYHEVLPELPSVRVWTPARQAKLRARWREDRERQSLGWWREYFQTVRRSPFLMGQTHSNGRGAFQPDLDWLVTPAKLAKVIEGFYEQGDAA